jgi:ABC-2 type transport system permease protein
VTTLIELTLWFSVFAASGKSEINGFALNYYVSYAMWATFVSRITSNWMYEFRMLEDVESGAINGFLVRPMSFFEYYASQFLGYKSITTATSFMIPVIVVLIFNIPTDFSRLPMALLLVFFYLFFLQLISFCVSTVAFHLTRVHSLTVAKNLCLWLLSGELLPLDLIAEPYRSTLLHLPFCSGVYLPVGYLTGRIGFDQVLIGFYSTAIGILLLSGVSVWAWRQGLKKYVGTGA